MKKSKLSKTVLNLLVLLTLPTFVACGKKLGTSSNSNGQQNTSTGAGPLTATVNYNTLTVSFKTLPADALPTNPETGEIYQPSDIIYKLVISRSDDISTLALALDHGKDISMTMGYDGNSEASVSIAGLSNNTKYYFTILAMGSNDSVPFDYYTSGSATTKTGPEVTSFTTTDGVPTAIGTNFNLIWGGSQVSYFTPNDTTECQDLSFYGGLSDLNFLFSTNGQNATSWEPGNSGKYSVGLTFGGSCMQLCSANKNLSTSVCTQGFVVTDVPVQ